jgi:hemerythrin-like metal-binding protein
MAFMEWTDECSVGVRQFDDDHKMLFSIANELHDGILAGTIDGTLNDALNRLDAYTKLHFKHEEDMFERTGYPNANTHKGLHEIDQKMFASIRSDMAHVDRGQLAMELAMVLKGWLLLHIQEEDKKYGAFLNSKGIR